MQLGESMMIREAGGYDSQLSGRQGSATAGSVWHTTAMLTGAPLPAVDGLHDVQKAIY